MISGRGLGPTGGTLDKLESIPGFRTDLSVAEITAQVEKTGCVITGATPEIAPADRKLYALRDVTGTVESIPLITASILSKKLAAGLDALVLDVKFGSGAFMKSIEQASCLARSLVAVGKELGVRTCALLTDMNQVLGSYAGNAIEVAESIELLKGNAAEDLESVTVELGAVLLEQVSPQGLEANRKALRESVSSGRALARFQQMVEQQQGQLGDFRHQVIAEIVADRPGYLLEIDGRAIGYAKIELGAGRKKMEDCLDLEVGIQQVARVGEKLTEGQAVFRILSPGTVASEKRERAIRLLQDAFRIGTVEPQPQPLIRQVLVE